MTGDRRPSILPVNPPVLRVLSLNYEFPPIGGGGGNAHRHILREFTRFPDLQVTLITTTTQSEAIHDSFAPNVHIHRLPQPKRDLLYWRRSEVARYCSSTACFEQFFPKTPSICATCFRISLRLAGLSAPFPISYLVSVGFGRARLQPPFLAGLHLSAASFQRIYGSARRVVANSQGLKDLFVSQFPRLQADVIPTGSIWSNSDPGIRRRAGLPRRCPVTAARLIPARASMSCSRPAPGSPRIIPSMPHHRDGPETLCGTWPRLWGSRNGFISTGGWRRTK